MYSPYLLVLFLLVVDSRESNWEIAGANDHGSFNATYNRLNGASDLSANFAWDAQKLHEFQTAINDIMSKFLHLPQIEITLRSADAKKMSIPESISSIGDAIINQILSLANRFGITGSNLLPLKNNELIESHDLKVSIYNQLLRFPLEISPIAQEIFGSINNQMKRSNYDKKGYKIMKLRFDDYLNFSEELKFTGFLQNLKTTCSNFYNCLELNKFTNFDLKAAIGNLMNYPPEITRKILKNRFKKQVPYNKNSMKNEYNSFHAFVCHGLSDVSKPEYFNCLETVKLAQKCGHKKPGKYSKRPFPKKPFKDLLGERKNRDNGKLKNNAPKRGDLSSIVEFFMGSTITSSTLGRLANSLGNIIKKNEVGTEATDEIVGLIEIYNERVKEKGNMTDEATKNSYNRAEYIKMSNNLRNFENHFVKMMLKAIGDVHEVMSTAENILVDSASKGPGYDLSENSKALKCWSDFMDSVFDDWSHDPDSFPSKPNVHEFINHSENLRQNSESRLIKIPNKIASTKNNYDEPLKKFFNSLKRASDVSVLPHKSTALTTLANTFLLATVFYECIAVLAASIYRNNEIPVSLSSIPSYDATENWLSREKSVPFELDDVTTNIMENEETMENSTSVQTNEFN